MKKPKRTVARDLMVWLTIAVVATGAVLMTAYYWYSSVRTEIQAEARAVSTADKLQAVLTPPAWNLDRRTIRQMAEAHLEPEHVMGIRVKLKHDDSSEVAFESLPAQNENLMTKTRVMQKKGQVLGSVKVFFASPGLGEMRKRTVLMTGTITLTTVVIIVFGTSIVMHFVLRKPLKDLRCNVKRIADGDYNSQLEPVPQEDINQIIESVNVMRDQISSRTARLKEEISRREETEEELKQHEDHLEELVAERTERLEEANAELERSNEELEQFAYAASHDLQEPLRKVTAFGERLESHCGEELGEKEQDYLNRMTDAAERMSTLIEDLLTFSRVSTKGKPFEPVDLNEVVSNVLSDLEIVIEETDAEVEVQDFPVIEADRTQMRQLFQNLIANALKFKKEDVPPKIKIREESIRTEEGRKCGRVAVEDNGIGFDEKYLDEVFSIFRRLHSREEYSGSGVGLALCEKIVRRHGGTITAESEPGEGATFVITLPVEHPESGAKTDANDSGTG